MLVRESSSFYKEMSRNCFRLETKSKAGNLEGGEPSQLPADIRTGRKDADSETAPVLLWAVLSHI